LDIAAVIGTLGARLAPLLPDRAPPAPEPVSPAAVDVAFARAEALGRARRPPQIELAHLAAETFRAGGYAVVEAGTGTGKSLGYLLPAALAARASGQPVAVSTFTRVLQAQLVERELPFVQQLVPGLTFALLHGRGNYLSLARLAEELEDAFAEDHLPRARAWALATLVRFAASSAHGNLEELGYVPQALDEYLAADGAVLQALDAVRTSGDDRGGAAGLPDFYRRARENAERADVLVVNHALLLRSLLGAAPDEEPFAVRVVCDEAHTLEDAATSAVCTSATLTVYGQGFDFFLGRIGLEPSRLAGATPARTLVTRELPPAFDYHSQALLLLPNDLPAPRDSALKRDFPEAVAALLRRFIPFFGGRTLALFTSNARRDLVHSRLAAPLATRGFPVLCQGQGSLASLLDQFRADEATSLLGARSLWEGVDVPGTSLSYVLLEKLPYPSLGDPVEAARMSAVERAGENPFYGYLLPKMVIVLKQGFGRLVRSATDRGAAVLLDKRLRNSLYRTEVLRSLPDPTVGYESDVELFRRIAEWMGLPFEPSELPAPTVSDVARVLAEQALPTPFVSEADFASGARPRLLAVQEAIWGHSSFREGQEAITRDVLAGKDVLTLLPTGAGKSRTLQLPALIRPGLTLVISPLIALIRDQVEKLRDVPGLTCVAALVSGMDAGSQEEALRQAASGQLKLLYISPERLRDPRFRAYLPRLPLVQLVVDEAHCISTWGTISAPTS
jgi:ATP-dependent DNA helicase RecQ